LSEYADRLQHVRIRRYERIVRFRGAKLECDVYVVLAAIPRVWFFSDLDQIGEMRIPGDVDQRSELMSISVPK